MSVFHWSIYNLIADLRFFYAINMVCRFFLRLKTKEVIPRKGLRLFNNSLKIEKL